MIKAITRVMKTKSGRFKSVAYARIMMVIVACIVFLSGCATTPGEDHNTDPWETMNRKIYKFNQVADKYAIKPVSDTYIEYVHVSLRNRITNFFVNLSGINVFLNDFLQGKFKQGFFVNHIPYRVHVYFVTL